MSNSDWQLWMHPGPIVKGKRSTVKFDKDGNIILEPIDEVFKDGKLVSDKPALLRRCVVNVYKDGDEKGKKGIERAFAICYSSLQKHGLMKGNKLTKKGKKKSYVDDTKDREYEKIIQQGKEEVRGMELNGLEKLLEEVRDLSGMQNDILNESDNWLSLLKYIIDERDMMRFMDDIESVDEQSFDLLYKIYTELDEALSVNLSRGQKDALNRLKNCMANRKKWPQELMRNNIFKAAHSLGIKLPSHMF